MGLSNNVPRKGRAPNIFIFDSAIQEVSYKSNEVLQYPIYAVYSHVITEKCSSWPENHSRAEQLIPSESQLNPKVLQQSKERSILWKMLGLSEVTAYSH